MIGSEPEERDPPNWIPRIFSPLAPILLGALALITQITDVVDRLGVWVVVALLTVLATVWCIHLHRAKEPSSIVPTETLPKYTYRDRKIARWLLLATFFIAAIILYEKYVWKRQVEHRVPRPVADDTPTEPGKYPSVEEIQSLPTAEEVKRLPAVKAQDVNFKYKNASGVDLKLILFDCYYHHFPIDDPFAPKNAWRIWDFPATNRFVTVSDFQRGTGWYVFFLERYDTGKRYQLGTRNIFYSEWPTLTVTSTGNEDKPFAATFTTEE